MEEPGDAVGPDAGLVQEDAVAGASGQAEHDRHAGPDLLVDGLDRVQQAFLHRRQRRLGRLADGRDLDARVRHDALQRGLHLVDPLAGQDAAVHVRLGPLRQRIDRMPRVELGGHAGGAHAGVVGRAELPQPRLGVGVGRVAQDGADVGRHLGLLGAAQVLEIGPRDRRQPEREAEARQPAERVGQPVDGVVGLGHRAVAALVDDLELEALEHLLAGLHAMEQGLALGGERTAAALVERQLGVDQRPVMLEQVFHAVERAGSDFLAAGQGEDEVARRLQPFLAGPDHVGHVDGRHRLVVRHSAAVEIPALLDELEGVAQPVLAPRLDHVHMGQQQQGPLRARALEPRDEVAVPVAAGRHDDLQFVVAKSPGAQPGGHGLDRHRAVAHRRRGVDLDQLPVGGAQQRVIGLGPGRAAQRRQQRQDDSFHADSPHVLKARQHPAGRPACWPSPPPRASRETTRAPRARRPPPARSC
mmetsp:Transcript_6694/g.28037  ORF Transcript_6694/g.28037 Transcript_6694/m.28037 type:complete len:473 (-) Transcript_6694:4052-5470(-)